MRLKYLVSIDLDYTKIICNDVGPGYANTMGWDSQELKQDLKFEEGIIYIIDNRISEKECIHVRDIIINNPEIVFILKVVDPYFENTFSHFYYQFLGKCAHLKNAFLLSVYEPTELVAYLASLYRNRFIYLPYPYNPAEEVPLQGLSKRKSSVIITGAINKFFYPFRAAVWLKTRRSIARLFFKQLNHPGYPEMDGSSFKHQIIGSAYIRFLSEYKYMLLCPTRAKIELLKFHECAYAGCLPVGLPPSSFPEDLKKLFIELDINNITTNYLSLRYRWSEENHIEILTRYRSFLRENRNREKLTEDLIKKIKLESSIYTA